MQNHETHTTNGWKQLAQAFVDDHQKLTRGYSDARQAVASDDLTSAKRIADQLDQLAGPHIAFEERFLYPIVRSARGDTYASKLYHEHRLILKTLVELQAAASMDEMHKSRWLVGLQEGLEHAATCGTLLSHLQTLPETDQTQLLEDLRSLQQQPIRWSELHQSTGEITGPR